MAASAASSSAGAVSAGVVSAAAALALREARVDFLAFNAAPALEVNFSMSLADSKSSFAVLAFSVAILVLIEASLIAFFRAFLSTLPPLAGPAF